MKKTKYAYKITTLLIFLILFNPTTSCAQEEYSEINNALFDSPHMKKIKGLGVLQYQYSKMLSKGDPVTDTARVTITQLRNDNRTDQSYHLFSGEKQVSFPTRNNMEGNAIFMLFLESHIHQLERETGGSWRHFQRRIRWAMASQEVEKKEIHIPFNKNEIKAIQYKFQPYLKDNKSKGYGIYKELVYSFTLSDEIPGTFYEVRAFLPKEAMDRSQNTNKKTYIANEQLTFSQFVKNSSVD